MPIADEIVIAVKAEVDKATRDLKKVGDQADKTSEQAEKLGTAMGLKLAAGATAAAIAAKKLFDAGKALFDAYGKDELATIRLNAALQNNNSLTYTASARFEELASSLQKVSIFGDDEIKTLISQLAAMGRTEDQINDIVKASANFASATGRNLVDTGLQINKTFSGLAGELGEANGGIRALTQEQLKNGDAVKILNTQYAGFAEKVGSGATGASVQLKNATTDLKEALGGLIALNTKQFVQNYTDAVEAIASSTAEELNYRRVLAGEEKDAAKIVKAQELLAKKRKEATSGVYGEAESERVRLLDEEAKLLNRAASAAGARLRIEQEAAGKAREQADIAAKEAEKKKKREEEAATAASLQLAAWKRQIAASEEAARIEDENWQKYGDGVPILEETTKAIEDMTEAEEKAYVMMDGVVGGFSELTGLDFSGLVDAMMEFVESEEDALTAAEKLERALGGAFDVAGATFDSINDLQKNQHDAELARIQEEIDARKEAGQDTTDLEKQLKDKKNQFAKDEFEARKATSIAEAIVNGAVAFTNALKAGPIAGPILASIIAGMTTAQVATIGAQQFVPMAQGGITTGPTRALIGEAGPEAVIPLRDIGKGMMNNGGITIVQNVQGSIWRERDLGNLALGAVANASRGY